MWLQLFRPLRRLRRFGIRMYFFKFILLTNKEVTLHVNSVAVRARRAAKWSVGLYCVGL